MKNLKTIGAIVLLIGIIMFIFVVAIGDKETVTKSYTGYDEGTVLYLAEESASGMDVVSVLMMIVGGIMFGIGKANE